VSAACITWCRSQGKLCPGEQQLNPVFVCARFKSKQINKKRKKKTYPVAVFDLEKHKLEVIEGLECLCFPGLINARSIRPFC